MPVTPVNDRFDFMVSDQVTANRVSDVAYTGDEYSANRLAEK